MATIQTDQAGAAKALASCVGGDTLQLIGTFKEYRPGKWASGGSRLIVDASQAVLIDCYAGALDGIEWHGGTVHFGATYGVGLRFDNCKNIFLGGLTLDGQGTLGNGLWIYKGASIEIDGVTGKGFRNGAMLNQTDGFALRNFDISGTDGDGVDIYNSANGVVEKGKVHDRNATSTIHPDGVQLASSPSLLKTQNIIVRQVSVSGAFQGITAFGNDTNSQGYANIVFEENTVDISYSQGIALYKCDGGRIENNHLSTLPGSAAQVQINDAGSTNIERYGNTIEAYGKWAAFTDPLRPVIAPAVVVRTPAQIVADLDPLWTELKASL